VSLSTPLQPLVVFEGGEGIGVDGKRGNDEGNGREGKGTEGLKGKQMGWGMNSKKYTMESREGAGKGIDWDISIPPRILRCIAAQFQLVIVEI